MPKPIKKRRVDLIAVLKDHEIRLASLEKVVYTLIHKLSVTAREDQHEGELGSESEGQIRTDETPIEPCATPADAVCSESDGVGR